MTTICKPFADFQYLPHQEVGVEWMMKRENDGDGICRGGILADDMGLGKTWQTIGLLLNNPVGRTLLVAPPVLIAQWLDALRASSIPCSEMVARKWKGPTDSRVFITTYDKVWRNIDTLNTDGWDRVVLDEGHYIRNWKTRRALSINKIYSERKWILSGTPVQNGLSDFKSLIGWLGYDSGGFAHCADLAKTIIKRRPITLLADVMPAPPSHLKVDIEYPDGEEKDLFLALVGRLENAMEKSYPSSCILELYLRVQMFISSPHIYVDAMRRKYGAYQRADWTGTCSKLDAFKELLKSDNQAPTLVFCHFKMEMDYVASVARAEGYNVYFVRGGMGSSARNAGIEESIKLVGNGKPVLLVCQIVAANCGLNLQHLTRVIFYTQHWNPAVIDQALTRSYRYGQKSDVTIHHLLVGSNELRNIDRCMLQKHAEKRGLAKKLLSDLEFAFHPDFPVSE